MPGPWKDARGVIVTTTPTIEGHPIQEYSGIVVGEVIVGANMFRDFLAGIRDMGAGARARMSASSNAHATKRLRNCRPKPRSVAATRWWGLTSITR